LKLLLRCGHFCCWTGVPGHYSSITFSAWLSFYTCDMAATLCFWFVRFHSLLQIFGLDFHPRKCCIAFADDGIIHTTAFANLPSRNTCWQFQRTCHPCKLKYPSTNPWYHLPWWWVPPHISIRNQRIPRRCTKHPS